VPVHRSPFSAATSATRPMFGGGQPFTSNPFGGMGFGNNPGVQLATPFLANAFTQMSGLSPSTFAGTQNYYDQLRAQQYQQQQMAAMSGAGTEHDTRSIQQFTMGLSRIAHGRQLTTQEKQQAGTQAQQLQKIIPFIAPFVGAANIDAMSGRGGNFAVMSSTMHRAMRNQRDSVTGGRMSGASAGSISSEIFSQLFGQGADLSQMRGIGAGEAGTMYEHLAARGLVGGTTQADRMQSLRGSTFSAAARSRIAESALRKEGKQVTDANMAAMRSEIFSGADSTMSKVRAGGVDQQGLSDMAGGEALLRSTDATRISTKLKGMAKTVGAMKEIFGDQGRSGAPMSEIMTALDQLTQGQFANMSPARAEQMVRTTRELARTSGLGVQGILNVQGQIGQGLAARGGSQSFAPLLGQQAAAAAIGFNRSGMGDIRGAGALTMQQATEMNARLGAGAASSQDANAQFSILRMTSELENSKGMKGSRMAAIADALRSGRQTFTHNGKTERLDEIDLSNAAVASMAQEAGVSRDVARNYIKNTTGNEDLAHTAAGDNVISNTRRRQLTQDYMPHLRDAFGRGLKGLHGIDSDAQKRIGEVTARQALQLDKSNFTGTPAERQKKLEAALSGNLKVAILADAKANGMNEAGLAKLEAELTPARLEAMANDQLNRTSIMSKENKNLSGIKALEAARQVYGDDVVGANAAAMQQGRNDARISASFAAIGKGSPLARISDAIRNAKPGDDIAKLVGKFAGGLDNEELAKLEEGPLGAMHAIESLRDDNLTLSGEKMYHEDNTLTAAGRKHQRDMADAAVGMAEGGKKAQTSLDNIIKSTMGDEWREGDDAGSFDAWAVGKLMDPNTSAAEKARIEKIRKVATFQQEAAGGKTISKSITDITGDESLVTPEGMTPEEAKKQQANIDASIAAGNGAKVTKTDSESAKAGGAMKVTGRLVLEDPNNVLLAAVSDPEAAGDIENMGVPKEDHLSRHVSQV